MNKEDKSPQPDIMYAEEPISKVQNAVHLGFHKESNGIPEVQKKVQLGRRTMYIWCLRWVWDEPFCFLSIMKKIYVVPRDLYTLEMLSLTLSDVLALEKLQHLNVNACTVGEPYP